MSSRSLHLTASTIHADARSNSMTSFTGRQCCVSRALFTCVCVCVRARAKKRSTTCLGLLLHACTTWTTLCKYIYSGVLQIWIRAHSRLSTCTSCTFFLFLGHCNDETLLYTYIPNKRSASKFGLPLFGQSKSDIYNFFKAGQTGSSDVALVAGTVHRPLQHTL